jgi:lipoprotein NlpI
LGDFAGSLAALDRLIAPSPQDPEAGIAYQERAVTRQFMGDLPGAIADYRQVITLAPAHADYAHFFIWTLRVRLGERPAADAELADYFKSRAPTVEGEWARTISNFLLGSVPEGEFLAAAQQGTDALKVQGQVCEAWYYSGLKRLLAGDRSTAADYFRRCLATDLSYFIEDALAEHERALLR